MITQIQPVLVSRGVTSNAISYYTNYDNQATNATWWVGGSAAQAQAWVCTQLDVKPV